MPARNPGLGWRFLGVFERDRNFYLRAMEANILAISNTPPTSLLLGRQAARIDEEMVHGHYLFSSLLLPSGYAFVNKDASTRASLRTAIVALAIERWRLTHQGTLPDTLDALGPPLLPAVPVDPYDGKSLRFKRLSEGYVVYSVGEDGRDDGGKERPQKNPHGKKESYDITFTVER